MLRTSRQIITDMIEKHGMSYGYIEQNSGINRTVAYKVYHGKQGLREDSYRLLIEFAQRNRIRTLVTQADKN